MMKKRIASLFLALVMVLSLVPTMAFGATTVASGTCGDMDENLVWILDKTGTLYIYGSGALADYRYSSTPWKDYKNDIKAIVTDSGLTSIGAYAFSGCTNLKCVTLQDGLLSIGERAFASCVSLEYIALPESITSLGDEVFSNCRSLQSIILPEGVKSIPWYCFQGCASLQSITIPTTLVYSGCFAFWNCVTLKTIYYAGTREKWDTIIIDDKEMLAGADIAYNHTHAYDSVKDAKVAPSCTECGYTIHTCQHGETFCDTYVAPLGHSHAEDVTGVLTPPTCTKKGCTTYICSRCGDSYTDDYTNALGHTWNTGVVLRDATETQTGAKTYTCSVCGATKTETIPRLATKTLATPGLPTLANAANGITVKWTAVKGAARYRVYYKTGSGKWTKAGDTTGTSFTMPAKSLKSGTSYTFTVRCLSADGMSFTSSYNNTGKAITYIAQPALSSVANAAGGVTVKWGKVTGAAKYLVYYKTTGGKWAKAGETTGTSYTVGKLKSGTTYTFTVRAATKDGKTLSSYNASGKTVVYLARTAITGLSNSASKTFTVKWNKITGVTGYQVYYKVGKTAKTVTVKSASAVSKAVSGLSKGSTYSVYVRGYKTVGKVNYYSAWSAAKTVKISK